MVPAAATIAAAPTDTRPAAKATLATPAAADPAANTNIAAPNSAIATAPCEPYSDTVGRTPATTASAALAISAPEATNTIAAPNAIKPIDPAVSAGPKAAANAINAAIATTIPAITAIAGVPAFVKLIAAEDITYIPAPAINIAAPNATNPTDADVSCFPSNAAIAINAPIAATIPNIVAIAGAPASDSAIED